jgi:hypothetical protein
MASHSDKISNSFLMQPCSKDTSLCSGRWQRSSYSWNLATPPPHEPTSYRPKSLLPILSKVFEKLLLERLLHIVQNKVIPDHQFGFRQGHSIIHQTHRIVNAINEALESKQYCSAAFRDISQAFDRVWHIGLLHRLRHSLAFNYFLILKSYLLNRHFQV